MKFDVLLFISLFLVVAACKPTAKEEIEERVTEFAEAFYNLEYEKAQEFCTSQSSFVINLLATNITNKEIKQVEAAGRAKIEIISTTINQNNTEATVKCRVLNFLRPDIFNDNSKITAEGEEVFSLVKPENEDKWLVELHI